MPISTINEVLFMGGNYEDYAPGSNFTGLSYPPYNGANVYWRPGTVRCAVAGDLVINLPRKIATPDILCIHASVFIPASPATGWQGKQVLTLRDGGVPKLGFHMFGNTISAGQSWHYWNGSGEKTSLFGTTGTLYGGFANSPGNSPAGLVQGTLQRRTWVVRYDAVNTVYPNNTMFFDTIKNDWSTASTSPATSGVTVLNGSTGIDSIVLGNLEGALWSEVIVTLESAIPTMDSYGGNRLYMVELPPNGELAGHEGWTGDAVRLDDIPIDLGFPANNGADSVQTNVAGREGYYTTTNLPHPFGIVTNGGNPGDPWTGGYAGTVNGETWTWEPYGVMVSASGQQQSTGELSSTPTGPGKLRVGIKTNSGLGPSVFSDPVTCPTYSPDAPYTHATVSRIWEDNPGTGQLWTLDEINTMVLAIKAET